MKCRYCDYVSGSVNGMKCHLNTQHPEEYQKISEYLSDADAVMAEKSRANKWLRNGKYTPYARWDIWGVRL